MNKQLPALTGIRAIAAFMVFFHHFRPSPNLVGSRIFNMLNEGHVGVAIFFVLSGFLIAFNYTDSVRLDWRWTWSYLRNRFARIYPVFFLTTTVALIYIKDFRFSAWFYNLSLLRGFFGEWYFFHIGQAWSLTVELCFYLLAPVLLIWVGRIPIGFLCLGFYLCGYLLSLIDMGNINFLSPPRMLVANTIFGRCFEFLLGIWMFKYLRNVPALPSFKGFFSGYFTYAGLVGVLCILYGFTECGGLSIYSVRCSPAHYYAFPLAAATLIYGLWKEQSLFSRLLGSRLFIVLGHASFAFYLIHATPFTSMLGIEGRGLWLHFLVINILAIAIYYLYERPAHKLLRSRQPV